jgi:predicted nucleic acid-binding protein
VAPDPVFVDANILVYANASTAPFRAAAQARLQSLIAGGVVLCISRQICREYLATLSRPQFFAKPTTSAVLVADVRRFEQQFRILEDGPVVTKYLLDILLQTPCGGKQIHDANIVATMLTHEISRILSHNVVDVTRFANVVTVLTI